MIVFKKLRLKNFRSFGNQWSEVELDRNHLTLISAPNGSGKSTLLMAIEFCLFGKTGNLSKREIANNINQGECEVELYLANSITGAELRVRRGVWPNFLELYKNGNLVPQNANVKDYQDVVDQMTGLNRNIFHRIISINGSSYVPFLSLNQASRRAMVEDILEINELRQMNWKNNEHLGALENQINTMRGKIEGLEHTVKKILHDQKTDSNANREQIKSLLDEMAGALGGSTLKDLESEFQRMHVSKATLVQKQKKLQKDSEFWKNDKCPTCGQRIEEEFKQQKFYQATTELAKIDETLEIANEVMKKAESTLKHARALELQISNLMAVKEKTEDTATVDELSKTISDITVELEKLKDEAQYHQTLRKWLKDDGVRSVIISKYLPLFNKTLKKYLTDIGLDVTIELDKVFNATIRRRNGEERSYTSFSAGERARIDLCFLLSWKSLISSNKFVDTSLLFMDEIYDSVLDGEGLDSLINLLYNMENTNIFFISHREGIEELFKHKLVIEKDRGFSKIL